MLHYIWQTLLHLIPVLFGMTFLVFLIIRAIPGDPAQVILGHKRLLINRGITPETWAK